MSEESHQVRLRDSQYKGLMDAKAALEGLLHKDLTQGEVVFKASQFMVEIIKVSLRLAEAPTPNDIGKLLKTVDVERLIKVLQA